MIAINTTKRENCPFDTKQISATLAGASIFPSCMRQSYNGRPVSFKGSLEGEEFKNNQSILD